MLALDDLRTLPEPKHKSLVDEKSGTTVREVGHFLVVAKLGIPTNFILFD